MLDGDARDRGVRLVVAIVPASLQVYPDLWEHFVDGAAPADASSLDRLAPNRRISAMCKELGIPVVDLLPALAGAARSNRHLYFPINGHWTADGHRVAAEALGHALTPLLARVQRGGSRPVANLLRYENR
jgi:lysophospholipase L1-like esterase